MKYFKKTCSLIIIAVMCMQLSIYAFASNACIILSSSTTTVGDNVLVTVKLRGDNIAGAQFSIHYDENLLKYTGCSGSGSTSYNAGNVVSYLDNGSTSTYYVKLNFEALEPGKANIKISNINVSDDSGNPLNGFSEQAAFLSIEPQATTEVPKKEPVTEKKTAQNQNSKPNTTKPVEKNTETTDETIFNDNPLKITINNEEYEIVDDSAFVTPPNGFNESTTIYNGMNILSYTSADGNYILICVIAPSGEKSFFFFNPMEKTFSKYVQVSFDSYLFTPLALPTIYDESYEKITISLNETSIEALTTENMKSNGFYLIYGLNKDGVASFFLYDEQEHTIQRYCENIQNKENVYSKSENNNTNPNKKEFFTKKFLLLFIITTVSAIIAGSATGIYASVSEKKNAHKINSN